MTEAIAPAAAYGRGNKVTLRIGLIYMLTGFVVFCAMGLLGLVMRLDHAGWWVISPDWFYRIMTIHGAGMVAGLLTAAMGAQIVALGRTTDLKARWLWSAYFVYSLSIPFLLYAVLIGKFAGGWTALDPLPYHGLTWEKWAGVLMYLAFFWVAVGFAIYCIHVLVVLRRKFGGFGKALAWPLLFGRKPVDPNEPVPSALELSAMAGSVIGLITAVMGLAVQIPLFAEAAGLIDHINPLFSKNFIMFFGHAVANVAIYLSVGVIYALVPALTGRGGHTSRLYALAWNMTILLVITPTSHHLYQDFAQPFPLQILGQVASWTIVPEVLLITVIGNLAYFFRSGTRSSVPVILVLCGFFGWVLGGLGGVIDASMAANNLMHNTLWVPAHFHTYYIIGVAAFVWAFLYYVIDDLRETTAWSSSRIAAWVFTIGGTGFVIMFFIGGAHAIPRRYAVHLPEWHIYAKIAVPFVLLIIGSLLWLIADAIRGFGDVWRKTGEPEETRDKA